MDPLTIALKVSLVGIVVVFFALVVIGGVISLLRRLETEEPETIQRPPADDVVPEEVIAVITAAVTTALGKAVAIKRVRYGRGPAEHNWSKQGRVTIMASHVTRE